MNLAPTGQNQQVQLPEYVKNATEYIGDAASTIGRGYENVKSNVNNSLSSFSDRASAGATASQQFLSANTIIAKFAFIILVIILFIIFLGLGINLIQYIISPSGNPYIIQGLITGSDNRVITQDPVQSSSVSVLRSNNQKSGLEFTWSVWIYISDLNNTNNNYQHIFSKGSVDFNSSSGGGSNGIAKINNGPGLYVAPGVNSSNTRQNIIRIIMNNNGPSGEEESIIDIPNIPLKKWIHIAIRMQNTMMDIYVNGIIAERKVLQYVPKQNFNDILVCQNGGFSGNLSNLRYYSSALSVVQINSIVFWGPNLKANSGVIKDKSADYLSTAWYTGVGV